MGTRLTPEQTDFVAAVRDFAKRECGTRDQRDALTGSGREPHSAELYARLADFGWLGVCLPEEYGGAGGGLADACLLLEETSYGMVPAGGFITTVITAKAYERFGTERQKAEVLAGAVRGAVLAIAMSEPAAGSDVGALSCRARRGPGGDWLIDGQKTWISNAHVADSILLVARTGGAKHAGLTMFHVPAGTPGVEIRGIETMGGREVNDVFFSGVRLPVDAVVGEVDNGWRQLMAGLNYERLFLAATMRGLARRAFDDAVAYVREREQFGRPVGSSRRCGTGVHPAAGPGGGRGLRRRTGPALPPRGVHGQAQGHRDRQAGRPRRHTADGRLRLRHRLRHGTPSAGGGRLHRLRRDERDPAGHDRQELRTLTDARRRRTLPSGVERPPP